MKISSPSNFLKAAPLWDIFNEYRKLYSFRTTNMQKNNKFMIFTSTEPSSSENFL